MNIVEKNLTLIIQILLLGVLASVPFVRVNEVYFPFVSGKVYLFRALVATAFFFWVWFLYKDFLVRQKIKYVSKNILVGALGLFFLAQVVASFFGVDPVYSFFSSIERADGVLQYGFWVLYFLMFVSVFREERAWKAFFLVFLGVSLLLSVYSWLNYESQLQLSGIFGNPAYFAAFLLFSIGFALVAYERKFFYPHPIHYGFLAATIFFVLTLVFTQVRGAYVGLAGGVFLFCLLSLLFLWRQNKKIALVSGIVLVSGFLSLAVLFAAKDTDIVQDTRLLWRITEVTDFWESGSVRERVLNWSIALKAFQERPMFGYGPENFGSAANKYYDYRVGQGEPWFDRAHNQAFDTLATGGIMVFSAYVFWIGVALFFIFRISRKEKVLSFLLASIFLAYLLQGFFLFDLLAVYLGLFPFLAFLVYKEQKAKNLASGKVASDKEDLPKKMQYNRQISKYLVLIFVAFVSVFIIYTTAVVPYKASAAAIQFYAYTNSNLYKEAIPFLQEAFRVKSPYTFWEIRKRAGWQFVQVLEYQVGKETSSEKIGELQEIYHIMTAELEKFIEAKPHEPQVYYVLGRTYRFGYEKLGQDDLGKAEAILEKAFEYSDLRVDYYNEYARVLLLGGKLEEAEASVRDYTSRVQFSEYFPYLTLGHFYFVAEKYEEAIEQYEKAREVGYAFVEVTPEYARYMFAAERVGDYEKVVNMAKAYLERWGPDADTYFNVAVGYWNLGDTRQTSEFFLKAIELDSKYEEYRSLLFE